MATTTDPPQTRRSALAGALAVVVCLAACSRWRPPVGCLLA